MDTLKTDVELDEPFERFGRGCVVLCQQGGKFFCYSFRSGGHPATDFVGQAFVFAHSKPVLAAVAGSAFQHRVQVLDAFLGSASTLIACEQLNRSCFGIEMEPKFVDVAVKRYLQLKKDDGSDVYVIRNGQKIGYADIIRSVENT